MKPSRVISLFDLLANTLVFVIIVMLIIPSELTEAQLAQIQPGMSIGHVKQALGEPLSGTWRFKVLDDDPTSYRFVFSKHSYWWKPGITATIKGHLLSNEHSKIAIWIGKTHLLFVEYGTSVIMRTELVPITRTGGGLQGCIDTLKQYWHDWRK